MEFRRVLFRYQGPRQPYDAALAKQTLKSAGVTAMLLHDEFLVGMTVEGNDEASRAARCRPFGWMLDALHEVPMEQRVTATRPMHNEGLLQPAQLLREHGRAECGERGHADDENPM